MWPYLVAMAAMSMAKTGQENAHRIENLKENAVTRRLSPWLKDRQYKDTTRPDAMGNLMQGVGAGMQMGNMAAQTNRLNSGGNFWNSGRNPDLATNSSSSNPWGTLNKPKSYLWD